jgi:AcrR family transcriptional regulator
LNAESDTRNALRRSDAVATRSKVLEAAAQVFAEQGFSAEVKDIADRAGVGVATIYRGFGSKDGLVQATIEQADYAIEALISEAERAEHTEGPLEAVRLIVVGMLNYAESYGWLIQAALAGTNIVRSEASIQWQEQRRERTVELFRRAIESGAIHSGLDERVVKLLLDGTVVQLTVRKMRKQAYPSVEEVTSTLMLMLTGEGQAPGAA